MVCVYLTRRRYGACANASRSGGAVRRGIPSESFHCQELSTRVTATVRPMKATDVRAVALIHEVAFPGFFLTGLGGSFLRHYYRAFPRHEDTIALVAEAIPGGDVVGFVVGASNPRGFYRRLLKRQWVGFALRAAVALARKPFAARRLVRGLTHPGRNPGGREVVGLFSVAVAPAAQGSRVAESLMSAFLARAAARGARSVFLQTDAHDNARANAYYRRHGFKVQRVITTPEGRSLNEYWRTLESTVGVESR